MIVCNHVSWMDVVVMACSPMRPSFLAAVHVGKIPLVGALSRGLNSLFVSRSGSEEQKKRVVAQVIER